MNLKPITGALKKDTEYYLPDGTGPFFYMFSDSPDDMLNIVVRKKGEPLFLTTYKTFSYAYRELVKKDDRIISLEKAKTLPVNTVVEVSNDGKSWKKLLFKGVGSVEFQASLTLLSEEVAHWGYIRWPEGPKMVAKLVPLEEKPEENCDNCNRFNYSGITCGICENFSKWEPQQ